MRILNIILEGKEFKVKGKRREWSRGKKDRD